MDRATTVALAETLARDESAYVAEGGRAADASIGAFVRQDARSAAIARADRTLIIRGPRVVE